MSEKQFEVVCMPQDMLTYLEHYGPHFNKKSAEYALSLMKDREGKPIKPHTKESATEFLEKYGVKIRPTETYDAVYVLCMGIADFLNSAIADERHLALFVSDYLNDKDGYEGQPFIRWYADMQHEHTPIYWSDLL